MSLDRRLFPKKPNGQSTFASGGPLRLGPSDPSMYIKLTSGHSMSGPTDHPLYGHPGSGRVQPQGSGYSIHGPRQEPIVHQSQIVLSRHLTSVPVCARYRGSSLSSSLPTLLPRVHLQVLLTMNVHQFSLPSQIGGGPI